MKHFYFKALFAFAVTFILQSSMRFLPGVGLGEILLLLVIASSIYASILSPERLPKLNDAVFPYSINFYVFTILFLITALNFYLQTIGTSFRDFIAYALSGLMLFALALHKEKTMDIAKLVVHFSVLLIALQYFFGDQTNFDIKENDPLSFQRFKAGANNPNQLALYLVCLITISLLVVENKYLKFFYYILFTYFGLLTFSDALLAFLAVSITSYFFLLVIPKRHIYVGITGYLFLLISLLSLFFDQSFNFLSEQFNERDQGNARFILYWNGLLAWIDNPISIIFGNGAGNYSGLYGPYGLFEAHSGPIDTLAMGGLVGLLILFFYPIRFIYQAFIMQEKLLFSLLLGLSFFCLFHFLIRHPIYWFTLFVVYTYIDQKLNMRKKCAD
jgi:hypothetical protein